MSEDMTSSSELLIDVPEALTSAAETVNSTDLIDIPSFLSNDDDGISLLADCGSCQSVTQSCGTGESGSCSSCEGLGCMASNCQTACQSSCQTTCEKTTQKCTTTCEKSCQDSCEKTCQDDCEYYEGDCNSCMVTAEECGGSEGDCDSCEGTTQGCSQSCSESCTASSEGATALEDPTWEIQTFDDESIKGKVTDKGDYTYFSWSLRDATGSTIISGPTSYSTSTAKTFTGLESNTTYRVYLSWATSTTGEGNYDWLEVTTTGAKPTWTVTADALSVTARVTDTADFTYFSFSIRDTSGTILEGPTDYSTQKKYTFEGLNINTTYTVYLSWSTSTMGEGYYDTKTVTTTGIEPWSWSIKNGVASVAATAAAYEAVTTGGNVADFSYQVWNDMVDKVDEASEAAGTTWDDTYLSWSETKMRNDYTLTAAKFNSLNRNITKHVTTGIGVVAKGDPVYGSYFTTLMTKLNVWIDEING